MIVKRNFLIFLIFSIIALVAISIIGCASWGGYIHDSARFKFQFTFPDGWEVWDKSDDRRDFLNGTFRGNTATKVEMIATPIAPDISPNELYPFFLDGSGDAGEFEEFSIDDKGIVSASNGEGRFVKVRWKGEKFNMRGYRALFIGNRYKLEVRAEMPEDVFPEQEPEFNKMVRAIKL